MSTLISKKKLHQLRNKGQKHSSEAKLLCTFHKGLFFGRVDYNAIIAIYILTLVI